VFSFIDDDFRRMLEDHYIQPKPRLELENGELVVRNVPVPESSARETLRRAAREITWWLDTAKALAWLVGALVPDPPPPAPRDAAAVAASAFAPVAERVFAELAGEARERGHALLFVYLPTRPEMFRPRPVAEWAGGVAARLGVPFLDLSPALEALDAERRDALFHADGHYSIAGNREVAVALLPEIRRLARAAPTAAAD
jgi:hypothetical protein